MQIATPKIVAANFLRDRIRVVLKLARASVNNRSQLADLVRNFGIAKPT